MATLRDTAIGILYLAGWTNIAAALRLRRDLCGPAASASPTPTGRIMGCALHSETSLKTLLSWINSQIAAFLTILVILLYGISRPAYDSFYSVLGLTPEDIGLSQQLILFRTALNMARELAVLGGLASLWTIAAMIVRRKWGSPFSAIAASLFILAVVISLWFSLPSTERWPSLMGLLGSAAVVALPWGLIASGRFRRSRTLFGALLLASAGYFFGAFQSGAEDVARDFMQSGRVEGSFGLILNIRYAEAELVTLRGEDALQLCTSKAHFQYLGGGDNYAYLLIRSGSPPYVARINREDYGIRLGVSDEVRGCVKPGRS